MTTPTEQLPDDIEALKALLLSERKTSQETIETLKAKCQYLEEQFLKARHQQFGASSEAHPAQGDLFNEVEAIIESVEANETETDLALKSLDNGRIKSGPSFSIISQSIICSTILLINTISYRSILKC